MVELPPDKRLLQYLDGFGVGNYQPITDLLKELFPGEKNFQDFINLKTTGAIWKFVFALKKNDFIELHVHGQGTPTMWIEAAIQPKGKEYIKSEQKNQSSTTYHIGDNAKIGQLSSSSLQSDISFQTPQINNPKQKKSNKILKNISVVILIILSILGIIKAVIELTKNDKANNQKEIPYSIDSLKPKTQINQMENNYKPIGIVISPPSDINVDSLLMQSESYLKPKIDTSLWASQYLKRNRSVGLPIKPRTVEKSDIQEVLDFRPLKSSLISIYCTLHDQEAITFAKELRDSLKLKGIWIYGVSKNYELPICKFAMRSENDNILSIILPTLPN